MQRSRTTCSILWLVLVCVAHVPLPCFDGDWEDRGIPFDSVFDPHAWHTLLLGIVPPDDIDRGPFRDDAGDSGSPYGLPFLVRTVTAAPAPSGLLDSGPSGFERVARLSRMPAARPQEERVARSDNADLLRFRYARRTMLCVMLT
jgi:hypothetical protein